MEKQDMRVLTLDPYQHGVVINSRPASANGSRGSSERKRNPIRAPFQRGIGGNL